MMFRLLLQMQILWHIERNIQKHQTNVGNIVLIYFVKFLKSLYRDFVSDAILMTTSFTWASMLFSSSSFSNILRFFCIKNGLFLSSIIDFLNDQTIAGASKATCNLHWCGQTLMWRWARSYRRFQEISAHWLKIR